MCFLSAGLAIPALAATPQTSERSTRLESTAHTTPSDATLSKAHALGNDRWARVYTQQEEDAFWARGKTYKASFGNEGTTYFPLLGPDKPRLFGFGLGSPTFAFGDELAPVRGAVSPTGSEKEVRYERGPVTEWYRLTPDSIEQLFTLDAPLGQGPLTVRIPVSTELEPTPKDGGYFFRNEFGGVHYGAATVLDANGYAQPIETTWQDGALEIKVPETFLAEATWPITIDPLITTSAVDVWTADLQKPDVAYDLTNDRLLITYEETASATDHDIYFSLVNVSDLSVANGGYWDSTTNDWYSPRVANHNFSDSFLVVAEEDLGSSTNVSYRIINGDTGALGAIQGVSAIEFVSNESPDVGGEVVDVAPSYWLIVWIQDNFNGSRKVMTTRVNQDGQCTFDEEVIYSSPAPADDPAVCNSPGPSGIFNIAYSIGTPGTRQIRGASVRWNGDIIHADHTIASTLFGEYSHPRVTGNLESAGNRYMVAFEEFQGAGFVDIRATICDGATPEFSQNLTDQGGLNLSAVHREVNVDHDGERFSVVWSEDVGGGNYDVLASTFALAGGNLCESESRIALQNGGSPSGERNPSICSLFGSGGPSGSTFAAWSLEESSDNIYAAHYGLSPTNCVGNAYCNPAVPNSTGSLGRILAIGSHIAGGNPMTLSADQMPANQFGFFVCATGTSSFIPPGSDGRLCLGGTQGRYSRSTSEILSSGPSGSFSLAIDTLAMPTSPAQPILGGQSWYFQAWHRDANPTATSNFTRATEVRFD